MAGIGRPKTPPEFRKNMVYVRLDNKELSLLDQEAKKMFSTRSGVLRKALYELMQREGYTLDGNG